ncbi:MAG: hypothetical protein ACLPT6_06700 [Desulfobaccales bacterium]
MMEGTLGIMVATQDSLEHLLGLVAAAERKGVPMIIFLTAEGVLLSQDPRFGELAGRAKITLCDVGFKGFGLQGEVPGLSGKDFATQAKHAEMLADCKHYVML